ncbi:hypothetical protein SO694_00010014 [Aureococcus anophagefferens]|uniref:J domain-containing protein n=1 Tax=Aureococcus anophagefferens TaxID=44056 RepID=A0ABR1GFH5_AURAN
MADDADDAVLRAAPTRSLYDVLGVPEAATHDDLRKAYRRLALKTHPDKCRSLARAAEAFLVVSSAYEVLADAARAARLRRGAPARAPSGARADGARTPDRKTRESEVSPRAEDRVRARALAPRRGRAEAARPTGRRASPRGCAAVRARARARERYARAADARARGRGATRGRGARAVAAAARGRGARERDRRRQRHEAAAARLDARRDVARGGRGARGVAAPARVVGRVVAPRPRGPGGAAGSARARRRRRRCATSSGATGRSGTTRRRPCARRSRPSRPPRPRARAPRAAGAFERSHAFAARAPGAAARGAAPRRRRRPGSAAASLPRYAAAAVCVAALRGQPFVVRGRGAAKPETYHAWLSHDGAKLQWRQGGGGAPTGAVLVRDLATVELKERKGAPVLVLRTPERRLVLEFLEGGDVGPDAWVATLAHLAGGGS